LDENSIIVAIDLMVIIYKCFTNINFDQLEYIYENLITYVEKDIDQALEQATNNLFDSQQRRLEHLEARRQKHYQDLISEQKSIFIENKKQIKRQSQHQEGGEEEQGTDLKYEVNRH